MVATKMASRCQACAFNPAGVGKNQMTAPMISVINNGMNLTSLSFFLVTSCFASANLLPPFINNRDLFL
jgi:hypothetical protein